MPATDVADALRVLRSPYRSLFVDRQLERRMRIGPLYSLEVIRETPRWLLLRIRDVEFWWPRCYETKDLPWLYHEVFTAENDNPHAYEHGRVRIQPGGWVVDAGACEGFFTHYALSRGANVICVEPVPLLAAALRLTFAKEINDGRVSVIAGGLGATRSRLKLNATPNEIYAATISPTGQFDTEIYTLDDIAGEVPVPVGPIDFVKMDIEGSEISAIDGAHRLLARDQPCLSIAVYHEEANARIISDRIRAFHKYYKVRWRGVWTARSQIPRPYMLHAYSDQRCEY